MQELQNLISVSQMDSKQILAYAKANKIAEVRMIQLLQAASKERKQLDALVVSSGRTMSYVLAHYYDIKHAH